jgi:hypothetical protein
MRSDRMDRCMRRKCRYLMIDGLETTRCPYICDFDDSVSVIEGVRPRRDIVL